MGYNYNGKLRSAEVLLREDGSHQVIRRAETPMDYFATFDQTPFYDAIRTSNEQGERAFAQSKASAWRPGAQRA